LENIVYSDSRLKKRFFVFLGRFVRVRLQSLQKCQSDPKNNFFQIILTWVSKIAESVEKVKKNAYEKRYLHESV
jgi:hypothetical protein